MKLLCISGAVAAILLAAVGLLQWKFTTNNPGQYLPYLIIGVLLSLAVNIFHLYDPLAALQRRAGHQPLDTSKPLNT
jgi:fatty acid desaturase